tara:strand:+ start:1235 stop:2044 length:810 start_codon:yes stop_codon:yes gene_type:complete
LTEKLPAMYFYAESWISGTRDLTLSQRGVYIDLLSYSQTLNGKGLPNDLDELCRMVLPYTADLEQAEKDRADLVSVINKKFEEKEGRFFNNRQHEEFLKGLELSRSRSKAGKQSAFVKGLLQQNANKEDKDKDNDKDYSINKRIKFFEEFWKINKRKIAKGQSAKAYNNLPIEWIDQPQLLAEKYNKHYQEKLEYSKHPATWLNGQCYLDEITTIESTSTENFGIQPKKSYKEYVNFVKKGIRSTSISDDMVLQMKKDGLITEEEFKEW